MKTGIIYCATSRTTGKRYVGQTARTLARRRQSHESRARKGSDMVFHAALRKHGAGDFDWEVLATVSIDQLDAAETTHIEAMRSAQKEFGYNVASVGGLGTQSGRKRGPFSEEHRRKISEAHKGKKVDPEHLRKLLEGRQKWKPSDEQRRAIGLANKGRKHTEEARRNMGAAKRGIRLSEEHRRKLSESHKGKPGRSYTAEQRAQIAEKLMGHSVSDETRRKISEALRRRREVGNAAV